MGYGFEDPFQLQAQAEGQGQGQAQLGLQAQGQGQGQGEYQGQSQSSDSWNGNGNLNGNANLDANGNLNGNANLDANGNLNDNANINANLDTVCVNVDVTASITPLIGDLSDSVVLYMPQTIDQTFTGSGTETAIALDQVNSLVANNSAYDNYVENNGSFSADASNNGDAHAGDAIMGALSTGVMTADTSAAATIDAFTQSIVLGANIQSNAFTATVVGGSNSTSVTDSSEHNHSVTVMSGGHPVG